MLFDDNVSKVSSSQYRIFNFSFITNYSYNHNMMSVVYYNGVRSLLYYAVEV